MSVYGNLKYLGKDTVDKPKQEHITLLNPGTPIISELSSVDAYLPFLRRLFGISNTTSFKTGRRNQRQSLRLIKT